MIDTLLLFSIGAAAWAGVWILLAINTRIPGVNEPGYITKEDIFSIRCKGCEERTPESVAQDGYCLTCWESFEQHEEEEQSV